MFLLLGGCRRRKIQRSRRGPPGDRGRRGLDDGWSDRKRLGVGVVAPLFGIRATGGQRRWLLLPTDDRDRGPLVSGTKNDSNQSRVSRRGDGDLRWAHSFTRTDRQPWVAFYLGDICSV